MLIILLSLKPIFKTALNNKTFCFNIYINQSTKMNRKHNPSASINNLVDWKRIVFTISYPELLIGKVVASHAEVARSIPSWPATAPIYTKHGRSSLLSVRVGGCDQSIGFTASDAIIRSWLWSTATRSSPLGYCGKLLQVVDNWPHIVIVDSPLGRSWP